MLEIVLQPKQEQLLNVIRDGQYGWIGMGGSRGGAKSGALRRAALLFILEFPRLNVVLFRKTLKDITDNHINPTFDELPELRKFYHVQNQTITMPHQDGDSRLTFVYEENESDFLNKFQGKNYDLINAVERYIKYWISEFSSLGNIIFVFHERNEKDQLRSTKDETKFTGKVTVDPQYLAKVLSLFNEVFRIEIGPKNVYTVTCKPDEEILASTTLLLNATEPPDLMAMLAKHKAEKAKLGLK